MSDSTSDKPMPDIAADLERMLSGAVATELKAQRDAALERCQVLAGHLAVVKCEVTGLTAVAKRLHTDMEALHADNDALRKRLGGEDGEAEPADPPGPVGGAPAPASTH